MKTKEVRGVEIILQCLFHVFHATVTAAKLSASHVGDLHSDCNLVVTVER